MQKLIIYNKGYHATGKSKAIKAVFFRLTDIRKGQIELKQLLHGSPDITNKEDLGVIFQYRNMSIGLESEGDPNGRFLSDALVKFKEYPCDIIICACRTKGETFDSVKALFQTEGGDYVPASCPHLSVKDVKDGYYDTLAIRYADNVIQFIDDWIDGIL
ncbi:MAG: hypothetical protein IJ814_02250 [Paludibacteraceae bacterium]|nr:hypothetical protein [Paludibacteraceae bacterium]